MTDSPSGLEDEPASGSAADVDDDVAAAVAADVAAPLDDAPLGPPVSALDDDAEYRAAVVDLLGVLAYGELVAFERLAADAAMAPTIPDKAALAGMATAEFRHYQRLSDRLAEMGADPALAMQPFRAALDQFHAHTAPSDWLEGLVKAYVGDGIGTDFYREIARYVDPETRALVLDVCADLGQSAFVVDRVRAAIEADPRVAGRLALWGRRLVGEALSQAQRVAADRDALAALLVGGVDRPGADLAEIGRMLARLTEEHTRRMQALGLAA
ncbi:MAG: ferritin-like fold-containing protein [Candidatus Nanopelagicales bacterium]